MFSAEQNPKNHCPDDLWEKFIMAAKIPLFPWLYKS